MKAERKTNFFLWDQTVDTTIEGLSPEEKKQLARLFIELQQERKQLLASFDEGTLREEVGKLLVFDSKYRLYLLTLYSLIHKTNPLRIEQINTDEAIRYYQETVHLQTTSDQHSILNSMHDSNEQTLLWNVLPESKGYQSKEFNDILVYYRKLSAAGQHLWQQLSHQTFAKLWPEIVKIDTKCRMIHNLLKEEQETYETASDLIALSEHTYKEYYTEHLEEHFLPFEENTLLNKLA